MNIWLTLLIFLTILVKKRMNFRHVIWALRQDKRVLNARAILLRQIRSDPARNRRLQNLAQARQPHEWCPANPGAPRTSSPPRRHEPHPRSSTCLRQTRPRHGGGGGGDQLPSTRRHRLQLIQARDLKTNLDQAMSGEDLLRRLDLLRLCLSNDQ